MRNFRADKKQNAENGILYGIGNLKTELRKGK